MTRKLRPYEKQARRSSLFPNNFDVMDENKNTAERMRSRAVLRHDWRVE